MKRTGKTAMFAMASLTLLSVELTAAVKVNKMFSDNMVLQRDTPVPVWGTADPGETVNVSFNGQKKSAKANENGEWMIKLDPMAIVKTPMTMTVSDGEEIAFKNVLVGDVWLCSGQSNMAMVLNKTLNAPEERAAADIPEIRLKHVFTAREQRPLKELRGSAWEVCSPKTAGNFSAVAYFFGRELHQETGVPIGLLLSSVGGTAIEPWTPPEGFRMVPELKDLAAKVDEWHPDTDIGAAKFKEFIAAMKKWIPEAEKALAEERQTPAIPVAPAPATGRRIPTTLYNGMIAPLIPYAIRGAIWYQGESSSSRGLDYYPRMRALINGWRKLWNQGDFPFYFVQLANFGKSNPDNPAMGDGYALIRQAQLNSLQIPNTGMAVIIDIGESGDIHPKNKLDVGDRLAKWALAKTYGKNIIHSGPLYKNAKVEGNKVKISFDHVGSGLIIGDKKGLDPVKEVKDGKLKWISVSDEKGKWHWAEAEIDGDALVVHSDEVAKPTAVRYAFAHNPEGLLLYNREGMPASPFQTGDLTGE